MSRLRLPLSISFVILSLGLFGLSGSSWLLSIRDNTFYTPVERKSMRELFGRSQAVRSDEFDVDLPAQRAQQISKPSFPLVNTLEGLGQLQRNATDAPVLDWGIPFRPLSWPILLTANRWALGVRWYFRSALLFFSLWLLLDALVNSRHKSAALLGTNLLVLLGTIAIVFSSSLKWWLSCGLSEIVIFSSFAIAAAYQQINAGNRRMKLVWTLIFFYFSTCVFFIFYPPAFICFAFIIAACIFDISWQKNQSPRYILTQAFPLFTVLGIGLGISLFYYAPYLSLMLNTVYPGHRICPAGQIEWTRLLSMMWPSLQLIAPLRRDPRYLGPVTVDPNICEMSVVESLPLFILLITSIFNSRIRKLIISAVQEHPAFTAVWLLFFSDLFLPLPNKIVNLTLLNRTPANRVLYAFGILSAILSVKLLADMLRAPSGDKLSSKEKALGLFLIVICLLVGLSTVYHRLPHSYVLWGYFFAILLSFLLVVFSMLNINNNYGCWFLSCAWALPLVFANFAINPIVRSKDLQKPSGAYLAIQNEIRSNPGRLVHYATGRGGLITEGYGLPSLNIAQFAPDLEYHKFLAADAGKPSETIYNRFAHTIFVLPPARTKTNNYAVIQIGISPCSKRLATLWVNHILLPKGIIMSPECEDEFTPMISAPGGQTLWSRQKPVCQLGVRDANGIAKSALEFDYSCENSDNSVNLREQRDGFTISMPSRTGKSYAMAVNRSLIDRVECTNATAYMVDAHLVTTPINDRPATCRADYLGSLGAVRRMILKKDETIFIEKNS